MLLHITHIVVVNILYELCVPGNIIVPVCTCETIPHYNTVGATHFSCNGHNQTNNQPALSDQPATSEYILYAIV